MTTFASLFTGGGIADIGAIQAGLKPIWGIEIDPAIAEVAEGNLKHKVVCKSVLDANPHSLDRPDILWASPPCQSFSIAKVGGKETEQDQALAIKIVDFIKVLRPAAFVLENVEAYKRSASLEFIEGALYALGYWIDRQILNTADFGVPQTRRRLILRAVLGGFPAPLPLPVPWVGWYAAIEDLIPSLPETQFAEWQLQRLPHDLLRSCMVDSGNTIRESTVRHCDDPAITVTAEKMRRPISVPRAFLVESKNVNQQYGDGMRSGDEPATTVCTDSKPSHQPKAFIVADNRGGAGDSCIIAHHNEPIFTILSSKSGVKAGKAFLMGMTNSAGRSLPIVQREQPSFTVRASAAKRTSRAWLEEGRVVAMNARALARFQTIPDGYELPDRNALACKIIGNGVPSKFAQAILETVNP